MSTDTPGWGAIGHGAWKAFVVGDYRYVFPFKPGRGRA